MTSGRKEPIALVVGEALYALSSLEVSAILRGLHLIRAEERLLLRKVRTPGQGDYLLRSSISAATRIAQMIAHGAPPRDSERLRDFRETASSAILATLRRGGGQ